MRIMDWGAINVAGAFMGLLIFWDSRVVWLVGLEEGCHTIFLVSSRIAKMGLSGFSQGSMGHALGGLGSLCGRS